MRIALSLSTALLAVAVAFGQPSVLTRARVPSRSELDGLNLKMDWILTLPVEGPRDGIATIQLIPVSDPSKKGADTVLLVAQMRSGVLSVHDANTGRRLWSRRPAPAYPVYVPEVAYDPRGWFIVVRDLNMYKFEVFSTVSAAASADESAGKIATFPTVPSMAPTVIVADPTKRDEGLIVVCFNGNKLSTYGKNVPIYTYQRDTSSIEWRVKKDDDSASYFKPGDNKAPSLTAVDSVFGPDYGLKNRPVNPAPRAPSLTMLGNLGIPTQFGTPIALTPSITAVDRLSQLTEMSRRDAAEPPIESTSRRGDLLDFRLAQSPALIWVTDPSRAGGNSGGLVSKLVLVSTEREIQIDRATERSGLFPERKIGKELLRSNISAPVAFRGNTMFVPTQDGTIYCIDTEYGLVSWSTPLQYSISNRPAVVGADVFSTNRQGRLFRLNAEDGSLQTAGNYASDGSYANFTAKQFLAASDRHVYAFDSSGNLAVLDRKRGTLQGRIETRSFSHGLLNDVTDRLILSANDGTLLCLRDSAMTTQKAYRSSSANGAQPAKGSTPEANKPAGAADTPKD